MSQSTSTKSRRHRRTLLHVSSLVIGFLFPVCSPFVANPAVAQTAPAARAEERERGIELFRQRKFSDAAKQLRKAVGKNKTDAEAWHYLGMALLKEEKQAKNAAKAFESALKLRPGFAPALVGLSYAFLLRNKLPEAIREARAALTIDPEIRDAHYILGVAHLRLGSTDDALKHAEMVVKLDPKFAAGYSLKSQALVPFVGDVMVQRKVESSDSRKARYRDAAEALEKYLQLDPNTKEKQTWIEQLESLRFYSMSLREGDANRVYSGKEVMTKARVLSKPEPAYTEAARQRVITGTVVLRAIFAADGKVKHILVLSGLPHGLTERSVRAARLIKFIPASIDGRPVSMFIQLEYNFNLY